MTTEDDQTPCIWVLAGTNGAGKSSIGGAMLREGGGDYYNPDEVARLLLDADPRLDQVRANAAAWSLGRRNLERALRLRQDYFFETTLGGATITLCIQRALELGHAVRVWYVGLESPELHIARVAARVRSGGHAISEADIRRRFDASRRNLIALLPRITELKVFDNSREADPKLGHAPEPTLVLHWQNGVIVGPQNLRRTPDFAKPIVAQAIKSAARESR